MNELDLYICNSPNYAKLHVTEFCKSPICHRDFIAVADPGFPMGGRGPLMWTLFGKNALADLGGVPGACPPMGPNSFIFTYIFTKKCPRRRSTPPLMGAHPPMGNPGSTTEMYAKMKELGPVGGGVRPPRPPPQIRQCIVLFHKKPHSCEPLSDAG